MSDRVHFKGRFVNKKKLQKKMISLNNLNRGQISGSTLLGENIRVKKISPGHRVVQYAVLAHTMKCCNCQERLHFEDLVNERRVGLNSVLTIRCGKCSINTIVSTSKTHMTKDSHDHADVNTNLVLGAVHAGIGCTGINKILACLNIPTISKDLFKRYEREVGSAIEECAKESCRRAAEEEKQLVIKNIEGLCEELPSDIVQEIYPFMTTLHSSCDPNLSEPISDKLTYSSNSKKFKGAVWNIVNIIVSYDMGWSKRGNGRNYDSLNGYGAIIGYLSGKILDFETRNRKCRFCDQGRSKDDHNCRQNFNGTAKAMEADVGASLVNNSEILKSAGVKVRVLIGDEDSSTIAKVRQGNEQKIFKLADKNHLSKHFSNDLYNLRSQYKEMRKAETIPHLKKCFNYAVAQNKGKPIELAIVLRQIPDHIFGIHTSCQAWCSRKLQTDDPSQTILLKDPELHGDLLKIFSKYADNAVKFSVNASSQSNESVNNMMAHKAPKNICYSLSESADYRFASTVNSKNEGENYIINVKTKLNVSPGKNTRSFTEKRDKEKLKRAATAITCTAKRRRKELFQERKNLRKNQEKKEGIQYKSNCGFDGGIESSITISDELVKELQSHEKYLNKKNDFTIIYFDLETSGFGRKAEILQIAAKFDNFTFNTYIQPTQPIDP